MSSKDELTFRKKSDIKFMLDVIFLVVLLILIITVSLKQIWYPGVILGISILFIAYLGQYIWSREWLLNELRKSVKEKDKKTQKSADKILDSTIEQKNSIKKYESVHSR